ncbi:MAG: SAM-dependent methyltransferase [Bacteroidetes bacterium]|nr:MAG: SAM-dependent methyltransferase [Bacteroidota bacterium]
MKTIPLFILLIALVYNPCNESNEKSHDEKQTHHDKHQEHQHNDYSGALESDDRATWQKPDEVISLLGDITGKTVVDIGSGTGYFTFRLVKKGANVIAVDVSDKFLERIKKKKEELKIADKQLELRKVPYDSPKIKIDEADAVIIVNTYHHIENRPVYFAKVLNGLKKDGVLMVVDYTKKEYDNPPPGPPFSVKMKKEKVIDELKQAGFADFKIDTKTLEFQYIILAKKD